MDKPNVTFVLADDLGWGDVGYHGSAIQTPNIDRMAQTGVQLDCHYVCPVCTPTRASLLTGRYASRFGKHATVPSNQPVFPDGYWTMAQMFKDAGYTTGLFGKWHLGSDPEFFPGMYGFDYSYGSLAGGIDPYTHRYKRGPYTFTWHRNGTLIEERGHATDLITREALDWLQEQENPWFCYIPYTAVHIPVRAPEEWIDHYSTAQYDADSDRDRSFKTYAAYTSHMDYCIGKLMEFLKCSDQTDNTIVVFASDNGAVTINPKQDIAKYPGRHDDTPRLGSNYPLRGHKAQLYEGGIRTPGIVSWPGRLKPFKLEEPINIVDWMPTFAALLDCPVPEDPKWDGVNILPLLLKDKEKGNEKLPQRLFYWDLTHDQFALRQGDWKLIVHREGQELFNLREDPLEEHNQVSNFPKIAEQLMAKIKEQHSLDDMAERSDIN
jgi:arylsulfatase A-like enzyme